MKIEDHIFEGRIKEFEQIFMEYIMETGIAKGTSPKMQVIMGYLSIHGRLTQKQLRELTDLSAGTISKNLKKIIQFGGLIRKERIEGKNEYNYIMTTMSELAGRISDIYSNEFVDLITFLREKLEELQYHEGKYGQELLSERIHDLIVTIQTLNNISSEIMKMLMPKK